MSIVEVLRRLLRRTEVAPPTPPQGGSYARRRGASAASRHTDARTAVKGATRAARNVRA